MRLIRLWAAAALLLCGVQSVVWAGATFTSVSYDRSGASLGVSGTGLPQSGLDVTKITVVGYGGSYTFDVSAVVQYAQSPYLGKHFYLNLGDEQRVILNGILNKAGSLAADGTAYSISFQSGWAAGEPALSMPMSVSSNSYSPFAQIHVYNPISGVLKGQGHISYAVRRQGSNNDITASKVTFVGEGGRRYTLTDSADVDFSLVQGSAVWQISLSATDKEQVNMMMNKRFEQSTGGTAYAIELASGWNTVISDSQRVDLSVEPAPAIPTIDTVDYDAATGSMTVTGSNFLQLGGANNDIVASKLRIYGQAGTIYQLTNTSNVDISSSTRFTLTLSAADKAALVGVLTANGNFSSSGHAYNLIAEDDWAAGADSALDVRDGGLNAITVSNFSAQPTTPPPTTPTPTPTPTPTNTSIPLMSILPQSCGVQALPDLIDVTRGAGATYGVDLTTMLSNVTGVQLQVPVSNACGSMVWASVQPGIGSLSLYVESIQRSNTPSDGVFATGDGRYQIVINGQAIMVAQATIHLEQLMALLPGAQASVAPSGLITVVYNGQTFVVRPLTVVQVQASEPAHLVVDTQARLHFVDSVGNNQILSPAFADLVSLRSMLQRQDAAYTMELQLDGTVSATLKGKVYTLVADYTLERVPADRVGQNAWQEAGNRFRYVTASGMAQGVSMVLASAP